MSCLTNVKYKNSVPVVYAPWQACSIVWNVWRNHQICFALSCILIWIASTIPAS